METKEKLKDDNQLPPFPEVLYNMIDAESKNGPDSLVRWAYDGAGFVIEPRQPQLNELLKKYFSHGKHSSLQRQLNHYSFRRYTEGQYAGAFYHPLFHKDRKHDLNKVRRKPNASSRRSTSQKMGTRKRKTQRSSGASEGSSLVQEAALGKTNGEQETYYDGSDISTTNENSTLGDEYEEMETDTPSASKQAVPRNASMKNSTDDGEDANAENKKVKEEDANDRQDGGKLLKLDFKGEAPKEHKSTNKIILPFGLKKVMINTWEHISLRKLVPVVPAPISVRKLLDLYLNAKIDYYSSKSTRRADENLEMQKVGWKDLVDGISMFFDKALPTRLLYRQELPQYRTLIAAGEKRRMSDVYGCEHLLRLLLRLPDILAECVHNDIRRRILQDMSEFVRFLHQHKDTLCPITYRALTDTELEDINKDGSDVGEDGGQ